MKCIITSEWTNERTSCEYVAYCKILGIVNQTSVLPKTQPGQVWQIINECAS